MMFNDINDFTSLAALVVAIASYVKENKSDVSNETVTALREAIEASEKTQTYLLRRAEGKERNRDTEHELAELWATASFSIYRVDKNLSIRLTAKSEFWRNPDTWETDLRAHRDISLESVTNDAKSLMQSIA